MKTKHSKKLRALTPEQYDELKDIASDYGFTTGGYQSNHGIVLYTSEATVYGDSMQELRSGMYKVGEQRQKRIKRQSERELKKI